MKKKKSVGILQFMKPFMKMTPEERKVEAERISKHKSPEWRKGYQAWRNNDDARKEASK